MRPDCCPIILRVSIFVALVLTLDADDEHPDCEVEVKVRQNTVYEAVVGEELRINCTVEFCSDAPPPVSWYKCGTTDVRVSVSGHIKTEWKPLKSFVGTTFLIFLKVHRNDSGVYQCKSGGSGSHHINVSIDSVGEPANVTENNDTLPEDHFWPFIFRAVGLAVFVVIIFVVCVASCCRNIQGNAEPSHDGRAFLSYL
ncbi:B- and T-lymphocyte attenuator-like isoform X1 [Cyclopterus lumpus]|uniref:B- and T-lymphocyte attenuator-like isoform X1 n=1 Tax=Cyclopterus lumpus TaxID=8103 RepID=UPI0014867AD1|nr:B- and T-lymphocyte attenuator-like isoform X1 [Cyclopterus lumpus]